MPDVTPDPDALATVDDAAGPDDKPTFASQGCSSTRVVS